MAEETPELPKAEEPKVEEVKVDVDGLLAELERVGIENPKELTGKLEAGAQAGNLARLLGEERKRSETLQAELESFRSRPVAPKDDFLDYQEGQTVDLESVVAKSVKKVLDTEKAEQARIQQASLEKWNRIQGDESYHLVKDVWESKLKDPNFVFKIQSGVSDPTDEYASTVREYYKGLLKQSHETIKQLQGGPATPPHVESGERVPTNMVSETPGIPDHIKRLQDIGAKARGGKVLSQEEELDIIGGVLGDIPL